MFGPIHGIDEEDVLPAVVVVVENADTAAHGFRQILLPEGAAVVLEVDAGLCRDVGEVDRAGWTRDGAVVDILYRAGVADRRRLGGGGRFLRESMGQTIRSLAAWDEQVAKPMAESGADRSNGMNRVPLTYIQITILLIYDAYGSGSSRRVVSCGRREFIHISMSMAIGPTMNNA